MTDETIVNGYFYLTDGTVSADTITYTGTQKMVKVRAEKGEHDFENPLQPFEMAKTEAGEEPETLFVNLLKARQVKILYGQLKDDAGNTKEIKRDDLITLFKRHGTKILVWNTVATGQLKYTIGLNKCKITEDAKEGTDNFPVIITCIVGEDLLVA